MKQGWEIKKLGEVVDVLDNLRKPITKRDRIEGEYPYYGATGILSYVHNYIFSEKLVLIGEDGAKWASGDNTSFIAEGKYWVNNHAHVIRPNRKVILDEWIVYFLNFSDLTPFITGMTVPKLNQEKMRSIPIPLPPLPEQQRIVSILDAAFAAIAKAKANAEQNLKNAKELFESYLNSIKAEKADLGSLVDIKTGKLNSNAAVENGAYPFFTCSREVYAIDKYAFDLEAILLAGNNASGDFNVKHYKGKFNAYQRTYVITVNAKQKILYRYLYFQLLKSLKEFKEMSVGANTRFLKLGMIQGLKIALPTIEEQQTIVRQLDALRAETQKLEAVYQKKIDDLEELKKSILQKAFAGELTSSASVSVSVAKVIPLQKVEGISPTDLQAGITAIALQKHSELNKHGSFGHVKAEKIVHLAEYILNIDLERNPVKDAAGPNDFPHAKKVESRAKKAGFYNVVKQGEYYEYFEGNQFQKLIDKTQKILNNKLNSLNNLLDLLIPINTQEAEVLATVYAAWNNLLIDGKTASDDAIVLEARENWHKNKLKISKDIFFESITILRKNKLQPSGNGRKVLNKKVK